MAYFSDLLGVRVSDVDGEPVGRLEDVLAAVAGGMPHPVVVALAVRQPGGLLLVPYEAVAVLIAPAIPLNCRRAELHPYQPGEADLFLARDVLDQQIIDTDGVRVVRVNDLELARVNGHFYVANVDVGGLGLLRRLGLARAAARVAASLGRPLAGGMIAWDNVELLPGGQPMRLRVTGDKMADLHPADLAELISHLNRPETDKLLESLDLERLADTLEEVETDFQVSLVETMSDEKVADVLEAMAPDEAADLLAEMPEDRSQELLKLMEQDEAADVRKLLTYPVDSAGGLMTTEFITVRPEQPAADVVTTVRRLGDDLEVIHDLYVTDEAEHLLGAFSLRDLVMADPAAPVEGFMRQHPVSVELTDSQDEVARVVAKYNLLAVPVVDPGGRLHGIVTADDALDKIIPTAWKKRLPRMYR
ncbi:MAG: magnesium transporter [Anaerolineales bacterium]|nr:magnesium transporter [Anaerolineales bacterium]